MFNVRLFPETARLLIVSSGEWDVREATHFSTALRARLTAARPLGRPIRILADFTKHPLQSPEVVAVKTDIIDVIAAAPIERYAIVTTSALVRIQVRRILAGVEFRFFDSCEAAAEWIEWPIDDLTRQIAAGADDSVQPNRPVPPESAQPPAAL